MPRDNTTLELIEAERSQRLAVRPRRLRRRGGGFWTPLAGLVLVFVLSLAWWGGDLLVADDPLPSHIDEAVVLQGSILGEKARIAGAMELLQQNVADRMLVSVPRESYWGQAVSPVAYAYIDKQYGREFANRTDFCETGPEVDSTEQEAKVLMECIRQHGWNSVAIVTSSYHTRRAGILWRRVLRQERSPLSLSVHGVVDPEFHARGWWRERLSAKTWLEEFTKLLRTVTLGNLRIAFHRIQQL